MLFVVFKKTPFCFDTKAISEITDMPKINVGNV